MDVARSKLQFYEWGADVVEVQAANEDRVRFLADWWDVNDTDDNGLPLIRRKVVELTFPADRTSLAFTVGNERSIYVRCQEPTT